MQGEAQVKEGDPHGVLVVDKPDGPTSHDVVMRLRRALHTKRIGHAGTLDPMATGVLVILVGEATKLEPYLSGAEKTYEATVRLGVTTASLDAMGAVTAERDIEASLIEELIEGSPFPRIEEAMSALRAAETQIPPAVSAIHVDGKRSYDLAREGKAPVHAPRATRVLSLTVTARRASPPEIDLVVHATKGFYVRSLARDLGELLGCGGHLSKLRRIASGAFSITEACPLTEVSPERLVPIADAARRSLPVTILTADATLRARQGKKLTRDDFAIHVQGRAAWFDEAGALVAIGEPEEETWRVVRGFTPT